MAFSFLRPALFSVIVAGPAAAAAAAEAAAADPSSPPLPPYSGPKPPWPYKGFRRFPAVWFGQNRSGLDNATQMDLEAKHQIVGWGWQQNFDTVAKYTSNETTGTGLPCNKTTCGANGTIYQQETSLAQMASRFAAYMEFSPPNPAHQVQGTFVYRHMEVAECEWHPPHSSLPTFAWRSLALPLPWV